MLTSAMGRLLLAMNMYIQQLLKADMFFSTMDMLLPELHMVDTLLPTGGYACPNLNSSTMSWISNTRTGFFF